MQYHGVDRHTQRPHAAGAFAAWGTLNNRRAASPLVWLVEGEERWKAPHHPHGFLSLNWGGTEQNRTVTCMVLKAKANHRRKNPALSRNEFPGLDLTSSRWWH
ncbi:uncharacterized protein TNCV_4163721 [Trichonephila clavipes]|nr:uncharacterized protein TNCV_4163721 [Trichonephila clavipes]